MKKIDKEFFKEAVKESRTIADVCRKIGWKPQGGNYRYVKRYIKELNLDISHFTLKGKLTQKKKGNEKNVEDYLSKNSYIKSDTLKWKLFSSGLKKYMCENCHCTHWNGKQISLQLHHINGDNTDNRLENLQILCPNCHSQTDNFCGLSNNENMIYYCRCCGKIIEKKQTKLCDECYEKMVNGELNINEILTYSKIKRFGICVDCGKKIDIGATRCNKCNGKIHRKVERPNKETLYDLIKNNSFTNIAKMYGVTDNAIRKWCKKYGLPYKKRELKNNENI